MQEYREFIALHKCARCGYCPTIKDTEQWLSLKCKCKITIFYPSGTTIVKRRDEYKPDYKLKGEKDEIRA
jgi:disulfide oxidoreductase YuzD